MAFAQVNGPSEGLIFLHDRLESHFSGLRSRRDSEVGPHIPIFALEHNLSEAELDLTASTVRGAILRRHLPSKTWLPFVVYATELGYEFSGDEYWQTFSARTPGWAKIEDREYIRSTFYKFNKQFGGAQPSGAWAEHRSIICWPITHAVLPMDLQWQLVQLLFEYRTALTSDLLSDPSSLGRRLGARCGHLSSRFRSFAQNTELLGQVSAALLVNDDEESPFLLQSTLSRIVETLSVQRQARLWLRDAKTSANRVRTHGFRSPDQRTRTSGAAPDRERLPSPTDPKLVVKLSESGWRAYLYLPDLSVLAERLPALHEQLGRFRVRVAGNSGSPLARRRLLVPGQQVPLDEWPDRRKALLQLEGEGTAEANSLLADQCILSPGPVWLFRIREAGLAEEVRGKFIRPGHSYVLLASQDGLNQQLPHWIRLSTSATTGVTAYDIRVPAEISNSDVEILRELGLGAIEDIAIRPAGVVPGEWDGEGAAEWLAGEDVVLAVQSNRMLTTCALSVDGDATFLDWPSDSSEIFIGLSGLDLGPHDVRLALFPEQSDSAVAEGSLLVSVRAAQSHPSTGTAREGLMLVSDPVRPSLSELWDGRAVVELNGPAGVEVAVIASLERSRGAVLGQLRFKTFLPVVATDWLKLASREIRGSPALYNCYNEADALVLTVAHPDLGSVVLRAEREFTPFRWIVATDRDGPFARLINNTEGIPLEVRRYDFASPAEAVPVDQLPGEPIRWSSGGLLRASIPDVEASVVLPPHIQHLTDLRVSSFVADKPRTPDQVLELIRLATLWTAASLSGDPFAQRDRRTALRAITSRIVSMICGTRWAQLEDRGSQSDEFAYVELQDGVGSDTYQQDLAQAISRRLLGWKSLDPAKRAEDFTAVLSAFNHRTKVARTEIHFAEFLLRLASEPASVTEWPENAIRTALDRVFESPVLLRAARFVVLAIHLDENEDSGSTYRGWSWR
jgi:hypothetical protein